MGIAVDGPYHGCPCGSTAHLHHRGLADSQWVQWQCQKRMFEEEQRRGMSAGAPELQAGAELVACASGAVERRKIVLEGPPQESAARLVGSLRQEGVL